MRRPRPPRDTVGLLVVSGMTDMLANLLFLLKERLTGSQASGVGLALVATGLLVA